MRDDMIIGQGEFLIKITINFQNIQAFRSLQNLYLKCPE